MKKVIVIDDQEVVTLTATSFLTRLGFEVHAFNNGMDALIFYENENIDLVLTDLNMPHINGFEIIRRLKGPNKKKVDIIAMSAVFNSSADIIKTVRLGVKDFMLKPFDFDALSKKISYLTEK